MTTLNLLPWREALAEEQKKNFFVTVILSGILALLAILAIHMMLVKKINHQKFLNNILQQEIVMLDKKLEEIKGLKKEKKRLLNRIGIIQELQANRHLIVHLFDNIARSIPDGVYLTSLKRGGTKISIEGKAESNSRVSKFMRNLETSKWIKSPELNLIKAEKSEQILNGFKLEASQANPVILSKQE